MDLFDPALHVKIGLGHLVVFAVENFLEATHRVGDRDLLAFGAASVVASAQNLSPEELNRRVVERRAFEAVVWGMPLVNYDLMRQEMLTKTAGKVNQVVYWGRPLDSKNQTLTPNPDALYFIAFFTTKDGPIVLDLPAGDANGSFNGNIVTAWQMPLGQIWSHMPQLFSSLNLSTHTAPHASSGGSHARNC